MFIVQMLMPMGSFDSLVYGATAILIYLKLSEVLTWSWVWVFAPFWGGVAAVFLVAILTACGIGLPRVWPVRERTGDEEQSLGR